MKKNIAVLCANWKSIETEKWKRVSGLKDEIIDSLEVVSIGNQKGLQILKIIKDIINLTIF